MFVTFLKQAQMSKEMDSGYPRSAKPKKAVFDGDETTRKVAPSAGIMFAPISTSFSSSVDASSLQTSQSKAGPQRSAQSSSQPQRSKTFRWFLTDVPSLPEFCTLEPTAVFVENASPSEVSQRISTVLKELSIDASYNDEKAKVRCMTASGVDFRIQLYRGRGQYRNGIIVEVQRRFGYAMDFHNHTNAILDAAQHLPVIGTVTRPLAPNSANNLPLVSDSEDEASPYNDSCLDMIAMMWNSLDSRILALQMLATLTDASKIGSEMAMRFSEELLKPDNEVGCKIVDLIVSRREDDGDLHLIALTVLANSVSHGPLPGMLREKIRPALLTDLQQASASNLLAAQQAARCLEYLWEGDHDLGELQDALETCKAVGEARHAGLEMQARKSLAKMVSS